MFEVQRTGLTLESKSCLLPMITARTDYFYQLYSDYKHGNLIADGGVNDQPFIYMQAMRILSAY